MKIISSNYKFTAEKFKEICDKICIDLDKYNPITFSTCTREFSDLGFDSLDIVELIMNCEKEFNIIIDDDIAEKLTTPKKSIEYLEKAVLDKTNSNTNIHNNFIVS